MGKESTESGAPPFFRIIIAIAGNSVFFCFYLVKERPVPFPYTPVRKSLSLPFFWIGVASLPNWTRSFYWNTVIAPDFNYQENTRTVYLYAEGKYTDAQYYYFFNENNSFTQLSKHHVLLAKKKKKPNKHHGLKLIYHK